MKPRARKSPRPQRRQAESLQQTPIEQTRLHLERLLSDFESSGEAFRRDPLFLIDRNLAPEDFEILSFIVAGLSYGRVEQIEKSVAALLERLTQIGVGLRGEGLARQIKSLSAENPLLAKDLDSALKGWSHRLNTAQDLTALLKQLGTLLTKHGSLCALFQSASEESRTDPLDPRKLALLKFSNALSPRSPAKKKTRSAWRGTGLDWFASSPESGGTCKRLMMWLRWMIREGAPDTGLWSRLALRNPAHPAPSAAQLYWPVDTHIFRWARERGLLKQKTPNWRSVETITNFFCKVCPEDPVKYDYVLCHLGMSEFRNQSSIER